MSQQHPKRPRLTENKNNQGVCKRFQRGICDYGDRCCFLHVNNHHHNVFKTETTTSVVVNVMNGDELREYRKMPMTWKTRLCHKWMATGTCRYGTNCFYAHGVSELQNQGSTGAQSLNSECVQTCDREVDGQGWEFKWKNVDKISRVYADWINVMPFAHVETAISTRPIV